MLHKESSFYSLSRLVAALLCLVLYLTGQFQQLILHQWEHSHVHAEVHSPTQEEDACHRSIFHHDQQHGCEHPAHLAAPHRDCSLCDCILISVDFFLFSFQIKPPSLSASDGFSIHLCTNQLAFSQAAVRGPPVV